MKDKKYIDQFRVRNLTRRPVVLGDMSTQGITIPPGKTVDILRLPSITKDKINQSQELQAGVKAGILQIIKDSCSKRNRSKSERQQILASEDIYFCDIIDVSLSGVSDNDIIQYNSRTGKWENQEPTEVDINLNVISVSTTYNALITDDLILCDATSGSFFVTLPTAVGNSGKQIFIKKIAGSNIVTVEPFGSETIDSENSQLLSEIGDCMDICAAPDENWFIT